MGIQVKPSDLQYRYPKNKEKRDEEKFTGKPDPRPFDRDDLYDVIAMFEAVMNELESNDAEVLHQVEEILIYNTPQCIDSREEMFDFLVGSLREFSRPV